MKVLLVGSISSTGKTTVARQLGLCLGFPWLQVDDLRLALQGSRVTLPQHPEDLYFFETPDVWEAILFYNKSCINGVPFRRKML